MKRTRLRKRRLRTRADGPSDKDLDVACRAVVFERDGYKCLRCGHQSPLQWSHVYSRRYKSIRWDPVNSMCLCAGCHLWWHHQPIESARWWWSVTKPDIGTGLRQRFQNVVKVDRRLTLLWLEQELKRLKRESPDR